MARAPTNPSLFSGFDKPTQTPDIEFFRNDFPPPSPDELARREAEEIASQKALAEGRARLPFKTFVFWNASANLKTTIAAKTETDARSALASQFSNYTARAWKLLHNAASNS